MFGVVGALGQLGVMANFTGYSRDYERDADRIGVSLMRNAGYDPAEAAKIWQNLLLETKARPEGSSEPNPLFASHPAAGGTPGNPHRSSPRRRPGGVTNEADWQQAIRPFLHEWLVDEVKRGQREESLALLDRMIARASEAGEYLYARGETYRLRAKEGDLDARARRLPRGRGRRRRAGRNASRPRHDLLEPASRRRRPRRATSAIWSSPPTRPTRR